MANVYSGSDPKNKLRVREVDGAPSVFPVSTIVVSNGTLTNDGGGQVTITTGGGGGGSGTVTSVAFSTGTTGLSVTGSPITTSGTITLSGTLGVANGGTGLTTVTSGSLVIGQGTGAMKVVGAATDGQLLIGSTGLDPELAALTAGNLMSVTSGAGTIQIDSTIQQQPSVGIATVADLVSALQAANILLP